MIFYLLTGIIPDNETNVNKLLLSFYNKLNEIVNKHAPFKSISRRKAKCFSKPWITTGIRKSIQTKNKLLSEGNSATYKLYRNKILTLTRLRWLKTVSSTFQDVDFDGFL